MSKVFVIDSESKPLLPTKPRRAVQLLDQGKAKVKQVVPFTIQLNRRVDDPVGEFGVGVDDGAKHVGFAIKNTKTEEIVFHGELTHRQDVSRKVEERKNYRRTRRSRNLKYRQPRFSNRIRSKLPPSIRQRKDCILRFLKDFGKRLNLVKVKVEEVCFNHKKHDYGKWFSLVEIGKTYLKEQIQKLDLVYEKTFGYKTKKRREELGLSKRHSYDACAIVGSNKINDREYFVKPRRSRIWENNPTKTCTEKNGFRHYDLVKAKHKTRGIVIGSIASLKADRITVRTRWCENFPIAYSKTMLLQRFGGLVYFW